MKEDFKDLKRWESAKVIEPESHSQPGVFSEFDS